MNIQKILLSVLLTIFWLFFILNLTYFHTSTSQSDFSLPKFSIWIQEIVSSENEISLEKRENSELKENTLYVDRINYIDNVYFLWNNYTLVNSNNLISFDVGEGLYLFDLYHLSHNYTVRNEFFSLTPKSPGKFFVDSRKSTDIKIFSFDSIVEVDLIANTPKETMTSIELYPHMFFWFNSSRNRFLKNADILRIESISKIFYVNESFLDENKWLNQKFFTSLYTVSDQVALKFFRNFFVLWYSQDEFDKYNISNIEKQLYKNKNLLWLGYIERYFVFFLNKEKKASYYKKNILLKLNTLFSKNLSQKNWEEMKRDIQSHLNHLQAINPEDYNNFQFILSHYYKNLLKINSLDYINSTIFLSKIIWEWQHNRLAHSDSSSFYLNKIYTLVDNKIYPEHYLQQNLLFFLNAFLSENQIQLQDGELLIEENKEVIIKLDFLSYFLKNIVLYNISFSDTENLSNILQVLDLYISINRNVTNYYKNNQRIETLIVEYHTILTKILQETKNNFFQTNLNERGLLVLNTEKQITSEQTQKLDTIFKNIFDFHEKNRGILSEKNTIYNSLYIRNKNTYWEYISALSNYSQYTLKYDKVKNELLNAQTVFEKNQEFVLSRTELVAYLSYFEGFDISNMAYKIVGNEYYEISNIYINGERFSFHLYPSEFNRLDNIVRNGQKLALSYELDILKQDLEKKYRQASPEEKNRYDFKRFFLNTFFSTQVATSREFQVSEFQDVSVEDRTITFFKRDKLFWDKWDFTYLKGFLDIKYDDVEVTLDSNNNYNTLIKRWVIQTRLSQNLQNREVVAIMSSEYVFSDKDHYFRNIYLTFYDKNYFDRGQEVYLFWGKEFRIIKSLDILQFKDEMNKEIEKIFLTN